MVLSVENNIQMIPGKSGNNSVETAVDGKAKQKITKNGCINIIGSSGTVYLSEKIEDPLLGEADQLAPGQSEDPMTTD